MDKFPQTFNYNSVFAKLSETTPGKKEIPLLREVYFKTINEGVENRMQAVRITLNEPKCFCPSARKAVSKEVAMIFPQRVFAFECSGHLGQYRMVDSLKGHTSDEIIVVLDPDFCVAPSMCVESAILCTKLYGKIV